MAAPLVHLSLNGDTVRLLDQRRLPTEEVYRDCRDYRDVADAIRTLAVRGAPAIGIAAAFGLVIGAAAIPDGTPDLLDQLERIGAELKATRPTAVNLFWAVDRMLGVARANAYAPSSELKAALRREALAIADEDVAMNRRIGAFGEPLIRDGANILTHCNAGHIATGGYGTALGVIRAAVDAGKRVHVYADETRPLLQGARLTAWELHRDGIPVTLITDSMAGHLMQRGKVDIVFVGADRIAANGDTANKIGTYSVAVLAREHGIPFYFVAPASTVDLTVASGDAIPIEERRPDEVLTFAGVPTAPPGVGAANPAFDVTPHRYVTGIVTDRGVIYPPFDVNLRRLFGR
ncbi:MAG: S-methyl-5-thioribose-1-phosphate isomerase [Chloroflexota bacterium]